MLAAIPIDTVVFVALVLIASFFRWISKQAEKAKRGSEQQGPAAPARPGPVERNDESDTERVRRFLEALGQPSSAPPPPPAPRRVVRPSEKRVLSPRERKIFSPLPPLTTVPPPLPTETQTFVPPLILAEVTPPLAPVLREQTKPSMLLPIAFPETMRESPMRAEVARLLSSSAGLRDAIVLREIFGPPRSLQTLEF
jgi:hypothetical protein